mmetsp:Transcript_17912/g.12895  ORF Transcript_17912/g.12895 Transcript_17912/m.12895 type:complete len:137 (+) Transcript_17912:1264-1674(+)
MQRDQLLQARQILIDLREVLDEDQRLQRLGLKVDYQELSALKEKISDMSSRYYELVPQSRYVNAIAPPLRNLYQLKQEFDNLDGLTNIEFASKILLGALLNQHAKNPFDYVYEALNIKIEPLKQGDGELEVVMDYI